MAERQPRSSKQLKWATTINFFHQQETEIKELTPLSSSLRG